MSNGNNQQPPGQQGPPVGYGMPYPFWPVPGIAPLPNQRYISANTVVPQRINVAMEYCNFIAARMTPRIAVTELNVEVVEPKELTDDEANAYATANRVISQYLGGQLPMDAWEKVKVVELIEQNSSSGHVMSCFACGSNRSPIVRSKCVFCKGTGSIIVSPVVAESDYPTTPPSTD